MITSNLDDWLHQATRKLSKSSAAQVRTEIEEHYHAARESAIAAGAASDEAERSALAALGDAKIANREYKRVLLTLAEERVLSQGNWEARTVCSHAWLRWLLLEISGAAIMAAVGLFIGHWTAIGRVALALGIGIGFTCGAPSLPIYTQQRSRVFRAVKWVVQAGTLLLAFGPGAFTMYWLLLLCFWQMVSGEWTRNAIRRKLAVSEWPRQLYL
jgi:hypothetical protein